MSMRYCLLPLALAATLAAATAQRSVTGVVTDAAGVPVAGARVAAVASAGVAFSDAEGRYRVDIPAEALRLQASAEGYRAIEVFIGTVSRVDVVLSPGLGLGEAVGLGGARRGQRLRDAALPVEVIPVAELAAASPHATLPQLLHYHTTSVTALPRIVGGPDDFVDPVGLASAGPGQVLVLVNGARRHRSALVATGGGFGDGAAGYDLAAIPLAAVERVEILRGPAAADYGPDAVAGVINVVLRREDGLTAVAEGGGFVSSTIPEADDLPDGRFAQGSLHYGRALGTRGGFLDVTAAVARREPTNRMRVIEGPVYAGYNIPGDGIDPTADITPERLAARGLNRDDLRERAGQAAEDRVGLAVNAELPLRGTWRLYGFGDASLRRAETTARYARPNEAATNTALYADGTAPLVTGTLDDQFGVIGARGRVGRWEVDLSSATGRSAVDLSVDRTANASLGAASPRDFDAGGYAFRQNVTRVEAQRYLPEALSGILFTLGAGGRAEVYEAFAGTPASYERYDVTADPLGRAIPGGATGLRGVSAEDAGSVTRLSAFGYGSAELDFSPRLRVGASVRYDRYEALGGGVGAAVRARVRLLDDVDLRGAFSAGVRAPALQETSLRRTYADTLGRRSGIFPAGSPAAEALGITPPELERHVGASGGLTARLPGLNVELALDGFFVDVERGAGLTAAFGADPNRRDVGQLLRDVGVGEARFLAPALDTRTLGATVGLRHEAPLPLDARLRLHVAATYARTVVQDVSTSPQLIDREGVYLTRGGETLLEEAVPRLRVNATGHLDLRRFTLMARVMYFGAVRAPVDDPALARTYAGKPIGEGSLTYRINDKLDVVGGVSNVFDIYPDLNLGALRDGGRAPYSRTTQQWGANGRYLFARLRVEL